MLRKNVAGQFLYFAGVDATTGAALTGATFSVRRSIDGTFAAGGGTITEDTGLGFYKCALTQADTNGNDLAFFFTATNAIPVCINVLTTAADPSDAVDFGLTNLDAAITSRMATYTQPTGFLAATFPGTVASTTNITAGTITTTTNLTNLPAITAGWLTAAGIAASALNGKGDWNVGKTGYALTATTGLGNQTANITGTITTATNLTNLPAITANWLTAAGTAADFSAEVADQVWDEILSGHSGVGSTGAALSAAGGSGDPWSTALPGAYGAGTAGQIVGDYLDVAVSSISGLDAAGVRSAVGLASANLDTQLGDLPTATENADALLNRDMSAVSDTNARSPLNALRFLRNKWSVATGTLTVTKENDTTAAWTAAVTTDAAAEPIIGNDPA